MTYAVDISQYISHFLVITVAKSCYGKQQMLGILYIKPTAHAYYLPGYIGAHGAGQV